MKIYQAVTSPFAVRLRIALYAKGLTAEFAAPPDGLGSEAFCKISPLGKVPTLVCDDGTVIVESAVINEYLEEAFPQPALMPADLKERARARMVTQMTDTYVLARYLPLFALAKAAGRGATAVTRGVLDLHKGLAAVEQMIDGKGYAVGAALSLADCALAPAMFYITEYAEDYLGAHELLAECPKLTSYWARIRANPHVAIALAET